MADEGESSSSAIGRSRSERSDATRSSGERSVLAEFVDAARTAAESLLREQKQQVADRVSGVAEALHGAARSLDQAENRVIARHVRQAGDQVRGLTRNLQERRWNELIADTEEFARREPGWFVVGAVVTGFLIGRFLSTAMSGESQPSFQAQTVARRQTSREVTAAVSSAPGMGAGTGEPASYAAGSSGMRELR
jgi:ElaB/YqjD/DUF883 family membrane-anchored ribosome-binding protein